MRIGYARVSTPDQSLAIQREALQQSECPKIFQEVASGAQAERQALSAALDYMRPGDTLVVWRLDRLGRSLGQLLGRRIRYTSSRLGSRVSSRRLIPPQPRASAFFRSRGRRTRTQSHAGTDPGGTGECAATWQKGGRRKTIDPKTFAMALQLYRPARAPCRISAHASALLNARFIVISRPIGHGNRSEEEERLKLLIRKGFWASLFRW